MILANVLQTIPEKHLQNALVLYFLSNCFISKNFKSLCDCNWMWITVILVALKKKNLHICTLGCNHLSFYQHFAFARWPSQKRESWQALKRRWSIHKAEPAAGANEKRSSDGWWVKTISRTVVLFPWAPPQAKHEAGEVQEGGERRAAAGRRQRRGHLCGRRAGRQPGC